MNCQQLQDDIAEYKTLFNKIISNSTIPCFANVCRICLVPREVTGSFVDLTSSIRVNEDVPDMTLGQMLWSASGIIIDDSDDLPTSVCEKCANKIQLVYHFTRQCQFTTEVLRAKQKEFKEHISIMHRDIQNPSGSKNSLLKEVSKESLTEGKTKAGISGVGTLKLLETKKIKSSNRLSSSLSSSASTSIVGSQNGMNSSNNSLRSQGSCSKSSQQSIQSSPRWRV